jgi:ectoine hydroxylase-related dioxygenase (phytanoyl-CoA dioxygenase family)
VYPATFVAHPPGGTVHKDYRSVQDMFTTWVPLGDVAQSLGGLAVEPGSQRTARVAPRPLVGIEPGWVSTDWEAGDVIVFHCMTTHAALPNREQRMRISAEYRWQLADQPAPRRMVLRPSGGEIGARMFSHTPWWRPVAGGLTLFDDEIGPGRTRLPVPPSRFI